MILSRAEIDKLIKDETLIENYEPKHSIDNPAKIELRLGSKCYLGSKSNEIITLADGDKIEIQPNDILLYQTLERVKLPEGLAGHLSLKMKYTAKGLFMSSQTQVDPGYNNYLFGMLYNLSNETIKLEFGQAIVSLELHEVKNCNTKYEGTMKEITFEQFCSKRTTTSLTDLNDKLVNQKKKLKKTSAIFTIILSFITVILTAVSIVIACITIQDMKNIDPEVIRLNEKVEYQENRIIELEQEIVYLEKMIKE